MALRGGANASDALGAAMVAGWRPAVGGQFTAADSNQPRPHDLDGKGPTFCVAATVSGTVGSTDRPPAIDWRAVRPVPSCSIVLATLAGWSHARPLLTPVIAQAADVGGEVIVADGSGHRPPSADACRAHVSWLDLPGRGVFDLRLAAIDRARGAIVVVTEDHCMVADGWLRRILAAHADDPAADIIAGRVDNGSRQRAIDWASFLINQLPLVPPIDIAQATRQIGIVGVSFTRRAINALRAAHPGVAPELIPTSTLRQSGLMFTATVRFGVAHVQSGSWVRMGRLNFHNARATAATVNSRLRRRSWVRVVGAPALLVYRTVRTIAISAKKDVPRRWVIASAPAIAWLYGCKAAGECLGHLVGPGDSASKME